MKLLRHAGMVAILGATAAAAQQSSSQLVEQLGDWGLYYNTHGAGNCLVVRLDDAGRTWQIGADRSSERAYLGVMSRTGSEHAVKSLAKATFDLDGDIYEGSVREFTNPEGIEGGYVWFNSLDFLSDLANAQTLKVTLEDGRELGLDLTGSKEALEWAIVCQLATTQ